MGIDRFADIAAEGIGGRAELLYVPAPATHEKKAVMLEKSSEIQIKTSKKMSTRGELAAELAKMREKYAPFLKNSAPKINNVNERINLEKFTLNGETVTIPHYGAPLGSAIQVYETAFILNGIDSKKSYFICFDGADYKASVYINGICAGQHEGFFSPFEFEITRLVTDGKNTLRIELENDFIYMGSKDENGETFEGDKLYAATGLGYDDPQIGWHHCPPGMGIYNNVYVEIRNKQHISDIFVRENEIWVEMNNTEYVAKNVEFEISVYGHNFEQTVFENRRYIPHTVKKVGMGDSLTEASVKANGEYAQNISMPMKKGINVYKIPYEIDNHRIWTLDTPYLYQVQIKSIVEGKVTDEKSCSFGIRSFIQDVESNPKGMFYLNGEKIRLRGANTMGFLQQCVLKKDFEQLIDDILLAKICNMNFLRLTQRPVQKEIYDYCDKLGLMTQTDLPLFGCMRRTRFAEGIRQAEEMERLVRNHPCNVLNTYINEPFPNANNEPHRHLTRDELESFFACCDSIIKLNNPDRVIKHVDGDYDPPSESMPDNHCYPMWYNGHGIDIGRLHKGYWIPVKPGWYYGCGEFGTEGLDFAEVMQKYYPAEWLSEPFAPQNIVGAQTGMFYLFFYDKGRDIYDWVKKSQEYQAFATRVMTEAFRRDARMISTAIHLFIDAWPAGWMKTIMDCERNPKPAYFAYKNALEPIMLSLRTDRLTYFEGETISVECYVCNDTTKNGIYKLVYEIDGMRGECAVNVSACDVTYASNAEFTADKVDYRESLELKAILFDENDNVITYNTLEIQVFADTQTEEDKNTELICNLQPGEYSIAGEKVVVKPCGMLPVHFVSRNTGHPAVAEFDERDFSYFYSKKDDMITPILYNTFEANGFTPILTSGNMDEQGNWHEVMACGEKMYNGKRYIICNVDLRQENPVAKRFRQNLLKKR